MNQGGGEGLTDDREPARITSGRQEHTAIEVTKAKESLGERGERRASENQGVAVVRYGDTHEFGGKGIFSTQRSIHFEG